MNSDFSAIDFAKMRHVLQQGDGAEQMPIFVAHRRRPQVVRALDAVHPDEEERRQLVATGLSPRFEHFSHSRGDAAVGDGFGDGTADQPFSWAEQPFGRAIQPGDVRGVVGDQHRVVHPVDGRRRRPLFDHQLAEIGLPEIPQMAGHRVEALRQHTELVLRRHRDGAVEVAAGDAARRPRQLAHTGSRCGWRA